jgi:hypothetical protein
VSVTAAIKFTQGANTDVAGRAVLVGAGSLGTVTCSNGDNSGPVESWSWVMVSVPDGSTVPLGAFGSGATATFTPTGSGSYLVMLTVQGASPSDTASDSRVFGVQEASGRFIPSLDVVQSALNVGGSLLGWAPYVNAFLRQVDVVSASVASILSIINSLTLASLLPVTKGSGSAAVVRGGAWVNDFLSPDDLQLPFTCPLSVSSGAGPTQIGSAWTPTLSADFSPDSTGLTVATITDGSSTSSIMTAISSSTNASPIVLQVPGHGMTGGGHQVDVVGHLVNTAANAGTLGSPGWTVVVVDADHVSLTGSTGNGVGGATGYLVQRRGIAPPTASYTQNGVNNTQTLTLNATRNGVAKSSNVTNQWQVPIWYGVAAIPDSYTAGFITGLSGATLRSGRVGFDPSYTGVGTEPGFVCLESGTIGAGAVYTSFQIDSGLLGGIAKVATVSGVTLGSATVSVDVWQTNQNLTAGGHDIKVVS